MPTGHVHSPRSYRFAPATLAKLAEIADASGLSGTDVLRALIDAEHQRRFGLVSLPKKSLGKPKKPLET